MKKININNFNYLTKNLNILFYKFKYISNNKEKYKYFNYFNKKYNYKKLNKIIINISNIIKIKILNLSFQKYYYKKNNIKKIINNKYKKNKKLYIKTILVHLDKCYIYIFIYLKLNNINKLSFIEINFKISNFNKNNPLKLLNYLINIFNEDLIIIDYKIRGIIKNKKKYIELRKKKISSIKNYINKKIKKMYDILDVNIYQEYIFYTKMTIKKINISKYIFKKNKKIKNKKKIYNIILNEIKNIFYNKK